MRALSCRRKCAGFHRVEPAAATPAATARERARPRRRRPASGRGWPGSCAQGLTRPR